MTESSAFEAEKKAALSSLGFDSFRPGQEQTIDEVLKGKNVLGTLPTGGGKTLIYQILALILNKKIIMVISPLTALIMDQVQKMVAQKMPVTCVGEAKKSISGLPEPSNFQQGILIL